MNDLKSIYDICNSLWLMCSRASVYIKNSTLYMGVVNGDQYRLTQRKGVYSLDFSPKNTGFKVSLGEYSVVEPGNPSLLLRVPALRAVRKAFPLPPLGVYRSVHAVVWFSQAKNSDPILIRRYIMQGQKMPAWLQGKNFDPEKWITRYASTLPPTMPSNNCFIGKHPAGTAESLIIEDWGVFRNVYTLYDGKTLPTLSEDQINNLKLRNALFM